MKSRETVGPAESAHERTKGGHIIDRSPSDLGGAARGFEDWVEVNSFIGREHDLDGIGALFDEGGRLVTVVGPGGIGKTRLARRFGRRWTEAGRPALFCRLTACVSVSDVCRALASVLGISLDSHDSGAQLARALRAVGPALMVLDNFEHLADKAGPLLSRWLRAAPHVRFLVSSQQVLGLEGENTWPLPSLALPSTPTRDGVVGSEAGRLFIDRARAARPGYQPGAEDSPWVADIVNALEGVPLAIELAAAQMTHLSCRDIVAQLQDGQGTLTAIGRDRDPRHRSLFAAIEWSWALLDSTEASALSQLSVCRGGFDLEAARAIIDAASLPASELLRSLCQKSLIHRVDRAGRSRYALFGVVREFALQRLRDGGVTELRHARHFVERAEEAGQTLTTAEHLEWLDLESANLAHIIGGNRAGEAASEGLALRAALALERLTAVRGPADLQRSYFLQALSESVASELSGLSARAWIGCARAELSLGHPEVARQHLAKAEPLVRAGGTMTDRLHLLTLKGDLHFACGELTRAQAHVEEALEMLGDHPGHDLEPTLLQRLGAYLVDQGHQHRAQACFIRAYELLLVRGEQSEQIRVLYDLAHLHIQLRRGQPHDELARAGRLAEAIRDHKSLALIEGSLGALAHDRGDLETAAEHYDRSATLLRRVAFRRGEATTLLMWGLLSWEAGARDRAESMLERALAMLEHSGDQRYTGWCLAAAGGFSAATDRLPMATDRLQRGKALLEVCGDPLLMWVWRLYRAQVPLAETIRALADNDVRRAQSSLVELEEEIRLVTEASESEPPCALSEDIRIALRLLRKEMRRVEACALNVGPSWFRLGVEPLISLPPGSALGAILIALAKRHRTNPEAVVSRDELIGVGWPQQALVGESGELRLRAAIKRLRKLGLADVLLTTAGGHRLDPAVVVLVQNDDDRHRFG